MTKKSDNARGLYLEGIRDGNIAQAMEAYTGDRYTQHSTGVADGKEGFIAFFEPFLARNPVRDIQIVRTIEDGPYVFCHVHQRLNDGAQQWVTADLFDTDERDRIVEHWDVIEAFVETTPSGLSMVGGPTEVIDVDRTDSNKDLVRGFVDTVLQGRRYDAVERFVAGETYAEHSTVIGAGLAGLTEHLHSESTEYLRVHRLIGQGNFVVAYSHARIDGKEHALFDVYGVRESKIVEHWDVREAIGPEPTWNNGGKF